MSSVLEFRTSKEPKIISLGLKPYREVWELQRRIHQELIEKRGPETLIFCEHFPVLTLGKSADRENLLAEEDLLKERNIEVIEVERGGNITWHGPGQLICYPLIDLRQRKQDVGWYMRSLETIVIKVLDTYGLQGSPIKGRTGVWIKAEAADRKIAALGVRISRWCTMHGCSLNVRDCREGFSLIHPCGIRDAGVTSVEEEFARAGAENTPTLPAIREIWEKELLQFFFT